MPTFEISTAYGATVNRWDRLDDYNLVRYSATDWTLVYDALDRGPYDPDRQAFRINLTLDAGQVTHLQYLNQQGRVMAELRDVNLDGDLVDILMSEDIDNGSDIFGLMVRSGTTFIGGDQESGQWDDRDYITTGVGRDQVTARGGNDLITDIGGADRYDGGTGFDTVTYLKWFSSNPALVRQGITVNMAAGTVDGPDGKTDRITSIEGIRATFLTDRLLGDANWNYFAGGRGADVINGRRGADMVGYSDDYDQGGTNGIVARLKAGFVIDGFGDRDRILSINEVDGTDQNDRFFDNSQANRFQGNDGDDTMTFSTGNDHAEGGDGGDIFIFAGTNFGVDVIEDFNGTEGDRIRLLGADSRNDIDGIVVIEGDTVIAFNAGNRIIVENHGGDISGFLIYG